MDGTKFYHPGSPEEGIEQSWKVSVNFSCEEIQDKCFRNAVGFLEVIDSKLYLIDYAFLTMAAQFEDELVPDQNFSKYKNRNSKWLLSG